MRVAIFMPQMVTGQPNKSCMLIVALVMLFSMPFTNFYMKIKVNSHAPMCLKFRLDILQTTFRGNCLAMGIIFLAYEPRLKACTTFYPPNGDYKIKRVRFFIAKLISEHSKSGQCRIFRCQKEALQKTCHYMNFDFTGCCY